VLDRGEAAFGRSGALPLADRGYPALHIKSRFRGTFVQLAILHKKWPSMRESVLRYNRYIQGQVRLLPPTPPFTGRGSDSPRPALVSTVKSALCPKSLPCAPDVCARALNRGVPCARMPSVLTGGVLPPFPLSIHPAAIYGPGFCHSIHSIHSHPGPRFYPARAVHSWWSKSGTFCATAIICARPGYPPNTRRHQGRAKLSPPLHNEDYQEPHSGYYEHDRGREGAP
jgi:hypothetical protein